MKTCHYCHAYYRGAHCESCMTPTGQPQASTQALLAAKPMPCVGDSIVYNGDPNVYIILAVDFAPDGTAIALISHGGTTHEVSMEWVEIDDLQEADHGGTNLVVPVEWVEWVEIDDIHKVHA